MTIDFSNPYVIGVIGSLGAWVISVFLVGISKRLKKRGLGLFDFFRRGFKEKTGLETYLSL